MLYLVFVLTFLASILFYNLTPHDEKLGQDTHRAETFIQDFLSQHQAAKDYVYTWLGVYPGGGNVDNLYGNFIKHSDGHYGPDLGNPLGFEQFLPLFGRAATSMCSNNSGAPRKGDECFVSRVVCTNSTGVRVACNNAAAAKRYMITYGGWGEAATRPSWWPSIGNSVRRYERWRRAIPNRTSGSDNCGTLFRKDAQWCIDNGEAPYKPDGTCSRPVPTGIMSEEVLGNTDVVGPWADMFFCMSPFENGYDDKYAIGLQYFYDGLDNLGNHGPTISNSVSRSVDDTAGNWKNLADVTHNAVRGDFTPQGGKTMPAAHVASNITFPINNFLKNDAFTLTVLVTGTDQRQDIHLISDATLGEPNGVDGSTSLVGGNHFVFKHQGYNSGYQYQVLSNLTIPNIDIKADALMTEMTKTPHAGGGYDYHPSIISWTMVKRQVGSDYIISVYENSDVKDATYIGAATGDNALFQVKLDAAQNAALPNGGLKISSNREFFVYGVRYYDRALTADEIKRNFRADSKRYGIGDATTKDNTHTAVYYPSS